MKNAEKCLIKSRFECINKEKEKFSESSCVILISVGQLAHEGMKLKATIDICNNSFKFVTVAVCDSLQRHSIEISQCMKIEDAYLESKTLGTKWIEKYSDLLEKCNNGFFRWDEWLLRKDFNQYKKTIIDAYSTCLTFKEAMNKTVDDYISRVINRTEKSIKPELARKASFNYLVEECAIIMLMWQEKGYNYIVYPSPILEVIKATFDMFVAQKSDSLLRWVRLKLKTKKIQPTKNTMENRERIIDTSF